MGKVREGQSAAKHFVAFAAGLTILAGIVFGSPALQQPQMEGVQQRKQENVLTRGHIERTRPCRKLYEVTGRPCPPRPAPVPPSTPSML
jgi:hypothetical protein